MGLLLPRHKFLLIGGRAQKLFLMLPRHYFPLPPSRFVSFRLVVHTTHTCGPKSNGTRRLTQATGQIITLLRPTASSTCITLRDRRQAAGTPSPTCNFFSPLISPCVVQFFSFPFLSFLFFLFCFVSFYFFWILNEFFPPIWSYSVEFNERTNFEIIAKFRSTRVVIATTK